MLTILNTLSNIWSRFCISLPVKPCYHRSEVTPKGNNSWFFVEMPKWRHRQDWGGGQDSCTVPLQTGRHPSERQKSHTFHFLLSKDRIGYHNPDCVESSPTIKIGGWLQTPFLHTPRHILPAYLHQMHWKCSCTRSAQLFKWVIPASSIPDRWLGPESSCINKCKEILPSLPIHINRNDIINLSGLVGLKVLYFPVWSSHWKVGVFCPASLDLSAF